MDTEHLKTSQLAKVIVITLFVVAFLTPRLINLDRFMATDEGAWLYRSGDFLYALGQRDFAKTYVKFHPGVVTSWAGSAAILLEFPDYYRLGQGYLEDYKPFEDFLEQHGIAPYDVMVTGRMIQILFLTVVMALIFLIFIDLVGLVLAAISFFLLAVDPFFIALTRMFHLDAPMAVLILFSISLYLAHLKNPRRKWLWLALSGAVGGIAGLAKITSALLGPVVVVLLILESVIAVRKSERTTKEGWRDLGLKALVWGGAALAAVFVFWPTMWVQPIDTVKMLLEAAVGTTTGTMQTTVAQVEPTIFFFYNPLDQSWMNYLAAFMWRTSPVILLGLGAGIAAWIAAAGAWKNPQVRKASVILLVFSGIYLLYMTVAAKQSQKYVLPALMMINLMAGWGLYSIPALLEKIKPGRWVPKVGVGLVLAGLVVQVGLMLPHVPYYWTYYNPLLGGGQRAGETIFVGTGEGLDLAGEYLNQKPDAEQLTVMSWYGTGCLSYFFEGEVLMIDHDNTWEDKDRANLAISDYLVVYNNQWFRDRPEELFETLSSIEPEKRIWLHGIEYARIYDTDDLPAGLKGE